jgi:aspartate-semialdehyde dehydrogenase
MKKYKVAVIGATGNVGREILSILDERNFPISEMRPLYFVAKSFDLLALVI